MVENYNIFTNVPPLTNEQALERLRHQRTPTEYYYCGLHLKTTLDSYKHKNFTVGSIKRYMMTQFIQCAVCSDNALFVVVVD